MNECMKPKTEGESAGVNESFEKDTREHRWLELQAHVLIRWFR